MPAVVDGLLKSSQSTGSFGGIFLTIMSALMMEKDTFTEMGETIYPCDYGPTLLSRGAKSFDFVIVGAGPGGCVLANRLTENPKWRVLLLEAGDAPSANTEIPYLYPTLSSTEDLWTFTSKSDNFCHASPRQSCQFRRGKALGGSSTTNNLHYERGTRRDFQYFGNWDFSRDIIQSYRRLEKYEGNQSIGALLGTAGELVLNDLSSSNDLAEAILAGAKELTYNKVIYPEEELGFRSAIGTIINGERNNIAKAFLGPIRSRPNLFVARKCVATKILTDLPKDRRVKGVELRIGDKFLEVIAKREVILCAGAINTAKLLLLSGFGPQDDLKELGIALVAHLPSVGKNLRDQIGLPIFVGVQDSHADPKTCREKSKMKTKDLDSAYDYLAHREGKLAGTDLNVLAGAINTRKDPYSAPNVKIHHQFFDVNDKMLVAFLKSLGYKASLVNSLKKYNCERAIAVFIPIIIRTESIGEVTLKSSEFDSAPLIRGNYVSDPASSDYHTLASAYDFIEALIETEPLARGAAKAKVLYREVYLDECKNYNTTTQQYVNCYIRSVGIPMGQAVGTAKMQQGDLEFDEKAVVNDKLLVEGIRHLRVVDASVIPEPGSANIECTVAMMGIKIAEDIKKQWAATSS